jgi:hypothetical protein
MKPAELQALASVFGRLEKSAAQVRIEPFESIVDRAVKLLEKEMGSDILAGVDTIVLESSSSDHYGQVRSSEPGTIYVSFNRLKGERSSATDDELVVHVAEILAHEAGHLKANFEGGEAPAEAKEREFLAKLKSHPPAISGYRYNSIVRLANHLDLVGRSDLADLCDAAWDKRAISHELKDPAGLAKKIAQISSLSQTHADSYLLKALLAGQSKDKILQVLSALVGAK